MSGSQMQQRKEKEMPRGPRGEKRPADVIGAAVMVGKIATGEIEEKPQTKSGRVLFWSVFLILGALVASPQRYLWAATEGATHPPVGTIPHFERGKAPPGFEERRLCCNRRLRRPMERRHWHPKRPLRSAISFWCTDYQWEHHLRGWRRCQRSGTSVTQRQCHGERSVGAQRCQRAGPPDARLRDRQLARPRTWRRVFRRLASLAAIGAAERRYIGERSETLLPKDPVARA